MKRILSKRSGFTLIEIIVAFAIFAIMSTMLMSMVQLTIAQRESNLAFQDQLERDTEYLALHYIGEDDAFGTGETPTGTFNLDFGSSANVNVSLDYVKRGTDSTDNTKDQGINYFVGDTKYSGPDDSMMGGDDEDPAGSESGSSQMSRYDTRLTGSKNLAYIFVSKCEKDPNYTGSGVRYLINISASGEEKVSDTIGTVPSEDVKYLQYKVIFRSSTGNKEQRVIDGKTYEYTRYPEARIIDYGYVDSFGNIVGHNSYTPSSSGHNHYLVEQTSDATLRISAPLKDGWSTGGYEMVGSDYTKIWVEFATDPDLDTDSFGDNAVAYNGGHKYTIYPKLKKDGTVDGDKKELNIYGAYPYQRVEITS